MTSLTNDVPTLHTTWAASYFWVMPLLAQIRPKRLTIESVSCLPGKPNYFNLQLRTQAGTYVKEFCHG